jgi:metal-responsive CopG/Arc/MetJ family transcriptional regulator
MDMRAVVSISFPRELASELDRLARESGRTKSELIQEALRAYLWEERFRKITKTTKAKAKKHGFVTDEDVFKAVS